eukprot:scaffold34410_cov23-Tisochrysis_lutea.AAC.1
MQANLQAIQNQKKQGADHLREQRQLINEHLRQRQEQQLDRNRKVTEVRKRLSQSERLHCARPHACARGCPPTVRACMPVRATLLLR